MIPQMTARDYICVIYEGWGLGLLANPHPQVKLAAFRRNLLLLGRKEVSRGLISDYSQLRAIKFKYVVKYVIFELLTT